MKKNIRILKSGLTVGSIVYREGDIVEPLAQTHDLQQLADGKQHVGHVWAEWVDAPQHNPMTEPVSAPEAEVVATHEEVVETAPQPAEGTFDLAKAIVAGVAEGKGKTAIIKELAKRPDTSESKARAEFDRLLATGVIAGADGVYTVA